MCEALFPDATAFFCVFFKVHDFHHFSSLTSSPPLSLSSPSPSVVSSLLLSLCFLLWSFLSLFCVIAAVVAALLPLLPLVARFGAVFPVIQAIAE